MDKSDVPIGAIQRILGHQNRSTTEIYLHSLDDAERDAIAVFEQAQKKSHTTLTQTNLVDAQKKKKGLAAKKLTP